MSNGVEVIVRGRKTALIGFDKTPWLPYRVSPSRPVTLPAHTVSRQFHLVEKPGKPLNNAVGHLLQSIVRSATPDMVTKTMVTTFTYLTTVLKNSNTIVKSREEIISNMMTQKFRPTMEYTPSLKSEPSTLPPELLASFVGKPSSYLTNTLTTTYIYYNTFTAGGIPVVLTSRETVSNVLTLPAYLSPTLVHMNQLSSTRVFETETYYSTYTFSKTIINPSEGTKEKVVTTKETVTQVVVTEALLPLRSQDPLLLTPLPPSVDDITKTYFTTFTHLFTEVGENGQLTLRSSISIGSETVTEMLTDKIDKTQGPKWTPGMKTPVIMNNILLTSPTFGDLTTTISQTRTLTPVLLYATKVYYTTYTYFTTVRNKDGTGKPAKIHSRTQVVSRVVTEALSTAFDVHYVAQLKSSYLSKHSTLLDVTSSVKEIIPTKTIEFTERPGTLVTQQVFHPHWPKDNDQLAFEVEGTSTTTPDPNINVIKRQPTISSSEEHFDEVKEGVHKIVSVLTNTKITPEIESYLKPKSTRTYEYLYSTATLVELEPSLTYLPTSVDLEPSIIYESSAVPAPDPFMEQVVLEEEEDVPDFDDATPEATMEMDTIVTERPVTHIPTPPLITKYTTKPSPSKTKKPIMEDKTELDQFPDIGPAPKVTSSTIVDYPSDIMDYSDDIFDDVSSRFGLVNSGFKASSTILDKRKGTIYFDHISSYRPVGGIDPSAQLFNMMSDITSEDAYEDIKENSEEDILPPTIYNIPATFDSNAFAAFNKQQFELSKLNRTQVTIKRKTPKPDVKTTSTTTTTTPEPEMEEITVIPVPDDISTKQEEPENDTPTNDEITAENEEDAEKDDTGNNVAEEIQDETKADDDPVEQPSDADVNNADEPSEQDNDTDINLDNIDKSTNETDDQTITEIPTDLQDEVTEKESSSDTLDKELEDLLEKTFTITSTTPRPKKQKTRYTTRQRPNNKATRRPITFRPAPLSDEESAESSTNVYALKPVRFSEDTGESLSEEEQDIDSDVNNKKDSEQDDNSSESYERRPSDVFHGTGPSGGTGPSKSGLTFPAIAGGTAAVAATGINWKPLLNLGAIGLGGLGASSLTKLGPLFNSVAGYMKGALLPIARNDTQQSYSKKSQRGNKRPNYARLPPKEAPVLQHSEPNYIPLGNGNIHGNSQNYRFSDERIPRRPVISHANEPNFRPIATDRDPDLIAGPLPPPIHFNINPPDLSFPPNHNYNFKPPNDHQPNIYTQISDDTHKNGDPPAPDQEHHYDSSPNMAQNLPEHPMHINNGVHPSEMNPEGKTEFILRPLQNLVNGRPLLFDPSQQGQGEGPLPQRNPGKITPVFRPNNQDNQPQRPVYRPRPGPASIEMINEIKDSQRQPFDRPPTIVLPHRKPQNQNNQQNRPSFSNGNRPPPPAPINIIRPPFINPPESHPEDNGNRVPWGSNGGETERFQENPFKDGNLNPPKLMEHLADSEDSFESHFAPGAQKTFFNQPGFITHDHFNDLVATPPPLRRVPNFHPDNMNMQGSNNRPPPPFDGSSPTFDHPVRAQEIPFHPEGETQASEESIYRPQRPQNSEEANNFNSVKLEGPPGKNELILHPHNGQNKRPFHPIQGSHEGFESQRVRDKPLPPPKNSDNEERPEQRPQSNFRNPQQRIPPPGRNPPNQREGPPGNPFESDELGQHHESAEDLFHHQHGVHSRPPGGPPPPWASNGPHSDRFPGPMNNPNGNSDRFPGPMNNPNGNSDRFPGPMNNPNGPNSDRFPGPMNNPNGNSNRFPGPMHPNERPDRFPGILNFNNGNSDRFPGPMNQPRPPQPLPVPPLEIPTQQYPPYRQNPSTVYIVEEHENQDQNHDEHFQEHASDENYHHFPQTTPEPYQSSNEQNTQYPKLIIKEVETRPVVPFERRTTTVSSTTPTDGTYENPTTNRAMISRLFIRKFKSTTTPGPITTTTDVSRISQPGSSSPRTMVPWLTKTRSTTRRSTTTITPPGSEAQDTFAVSPTMNDLMNFEQKFKQKYGTRRPNPTNRFDGKINITDKSFENADTAEYSDEIDEFKSSSNITLSEHHDHPNHHPVHKPPIDVTKYLTDVDEDEFGQLYQGTEDQDTIIDPVNQKVIKSPFETRRNISNFMRRSTTTTSEPPTTTPSPSTLSSSEENKFIDRFTVPEGIFTSTPPGKSKLWWPTTFRPKNNEIFLDKITPRDQEAGPTTFRGDALGPTTYRPGSIFDPMKGLNEIFPSNIRKVPSLRPAPQAGMASFYDDEDSMDQIKIKNSEIYKIPPFLSTKRPGGGIALVRPEDMEEYESSQEKLRDKLNKASESHKVKEYLDAYDSADDDEGSLESPSGFPSTKLQPPLQRPGAPRPPPQSQRPGPLETLTNFFRKPPLRNFPPDQKFQNQPGPPPPNSNRPPPPGNNGPPQQRPFIPQRRPTQEQQPNNIQIVRPQPPTTSTPRPLKLKVEYTPHNFNTQAKPIPLNPNIKTPEENRNKDDQESNGGEVKDDTNMISDDNKKVGSSHEEKVQSPDLIDTTGNGHRESSYMYDSEYYEEDDDELTDKNNNVIPPTQNLNRPQPPNSQNPQSRPVPPGNNNRAIQNQNRPQLMRPLNVGGHLVNGNNNRPSPFQNNQRPPQRPNQPNLRPPGFGIFDSSAGPRPLPPNSPKTEMEPPPIDSNRLKPPVLELPSSGPIRYRPNGGPSGNGNINRPNLLRPDDDLFKPPDRRPAPTIHTIASVDDNNEIVGTNTFTAILPSKSGEFEVKPTETLQQAGNINPTEVHLEGSEATVIIPSHSSGTNLRMSSVIKYTGGRLEISAVQEKANSSTSKIEPTRSSSTRVFIQRTRGPSTNSTSVPPVASSSPIAIHSTSTNSTNRFNILNRRPIQILRSTSTSKTPSEKSQSTSDGPITSTVKSIVRRPFIPTRGPGPNIIPWARRTQSTTTTTTSEKPVISADNATTTLRFSPSIVNKTRTATRFDVNRRPSSTSTNLDASLKTDESKSAERTVASFKPTTFRPPFRRPGSFEESSEETVTTINPRFVPAKRPSPTPLPTTRKSVFRNVTTQISSNPSTSDSEYEEYSDEYEEGTQVPGSSTSDEGNNAREVSTSEPSGRNRTVTTVVSQVSSAINPTRTNPRGGTRFRNTANFGRPGRPGPGSSEAKQDETTRYVTHTDSNTVTVTETETSVFSSKGLHRTQTVIITKTQPPQTLISTIVGTVTLVNTVDVRPTTVRTTIFSEPTKAVYTFVDTSESSADRDRGHDESTEKVLLGGIITAGNRPKATLQKPEPSPAEPGSSIIRKPFSIDSSCQTNCSLSSNQACRTFANGTRTKCDCKPGYARMKSKYNCRPTFTYEMSIGINHMDGMSFDFKDLYNAATDGYLNFITVTKEAIDKAFLATDIKRQFQGTEIIRLHPVNYMKDKSHVYEPKVDVDFLVQLTTNITEDRIKNHLIRTLKASNFSVGRTGISSTRNMSDFSARDFNECLHKEFQDCSPNAECLNVRGSFTCKCSPGYKDKSSKRKPGRDCHETSGCKECNFHGTCHTDTHGNPACHCFKWYGGIECQINLKFLLIAITGIGSVLFLLVLLCGTLVCKRSKIARGERQGSGRFMRYRSPTTHSQATLERTAIMNDSASSDGGRQSPHPITHSFTPDSLLIDVDPKGPPPGPGARHYPGMGGHGGHGQQADVNLMNFSLRNVNDRSLSVVIPRAKIRPPSRPSSRHAAIGPDTNADLGTSERKLISYLDQSPYSQANKPTSSRQSTIRRNDSNSKQFRKFSLQEQRKISQGALVSSGIEVSAMGGMRRKSTTGLEPEPLYAGYEKSVSEVRSFGETIRSPAKQQLYTTDTSRTSRASCYSCKPPSYCGAYSESAGHTMGDKDGASTVYTTQGKLFRMAHDGHDDDTCSTASSQ